MKVLKIGVLRASDIGGEACEDCERNIGHFPCAIFKGEDEEMREAARFLYKECEIVPAGTKARIAELEAENKRLREALLQIETLADHQYSQGTCSTLGISYLTIRNFAHKALEGEE